MSAHVLKPCPFCGEDEDLHPCEHFVLCGCCGAQAGSMCKGVDKNIEYWNTRHMVAALAVAYCLT